MAGSDDVPMIDEPEAIDEPEVANGSGMSLKLQSVRKMPSEKIGSRTQVSFLKR